MLSFASFAELVRVLGFQCFLFAVVSLAGRKCPGFRFSLDSYTGFPSRIQGKARNNFFITNMGQFLEKFLKKTLWLWLPFFAFGILVKELSDRLKK